MPKRTRRVSPPTTPPRRQLQPPHSPGPLTTSPHRLEWFPPATPKTTRRQAQLRRSLFKCLPASEALMPRQPSSSPPRRTRTPSPAQRPAASPPRRRQLEDPPQFLEDLTQALTGINRILERQVPDQPPPPAAAPQDLGPQEDPYFEWARLYQQPETSFPAVSTGKIQRIAAGLLSKLPSLTGRDRHEVAFVLSMASDYPHMPPQLAESVYQRMNLLYIATFHGLATAIAASGSVGSSEAVFPPGFQPPSQQRRQLYQPPQLRAENPPPTRRRQLNRGRGRGQAQQQYQQ